MSQEANIEGDPYLYADSPILRNLADIHDENGLSKFESDHFFARLLDLHENPIKGSFDSDHLRRIHHFLFQDVYAWAGEFRTVPIAKGDSFFARPEHVASELQKLFLHPFREGNGRAQREFIRELALEVGFEVSWDLATRDEMFAASVASFHQGSSAAFAMILDKIIRPIR